MSAKFCVYFWMCVYLLLGQRRVVCTHKNIL